jgi:hypothetical protein
MKKLLIGGGILVAVCAIGLVALSLNLGSVVTRAVNGYAPGLLKTRVSLSSARISPFSGNGTLHGFVIGNPSGWSDGDLVSIKGVHVSIVPSSIVRDHIIINEIDVDGPEFDYETRLLASNVKDLLGNIEQAVGARSAPRAVAKNGKPVTIEVRRFRVRNGFVHIGTGTGGVRIPLPVIELSDLGTRENGITPDQLAMAVMRNVTANIVRASADAAVDLGKTAGAAAVAGAKKAGEGVKKVGEGLKGLVKR